MLSEASKQKINRELGKYPADQKQSAVMAALAIAQHEKSWLATETIDEVAAILGMAPKYGDGSMMISCVPPVSKDLTLPR